MSNIGEFQVKPCRTWYTELKSALTVRKHIIGSFSSDYEYDYEYEIRHFCAKRTPYAYAIRY
jgi:hypothetical protein